MEYRGMDGFQRSCASWDNASIRKIEKAVVVALKLAAQQELEVKRY